MVDKSPRDVVRDEIAQDMDAAGIGRAGSERRFRFLEMIQDMEEQKKRQESQKERRTAAIAGIGYGVVGTFVTAAVTWATGVSQWLLSILTSRH